MVVVHKLEGICEALEDASLLHAPQHLPSQARGRGSLLGAGVGDAGRQQC